jgi:hypothetical protein
LQTHGTPITAGVPRDAGREVSKNTAREAAARVDVNIQEHSMTALATVAN